MNPHLILAYSAVALVAIASPGPAVLLALRNGLAWGVRSVVWSSLGNISGLFCLSGAAMLGLGVLLKSSAILFGAVKVLGALYLFYVGLRHLLGRTSVVPPAMQGAPIDAPDAIPDAVSNAASPVAPTAAPGALYREGFFLAATNPKPILFFTALFPQFLDAQTSLLPQFFVLTGIFMTLSFLTLMAYAALGARARGLLLHATFAKWVNRSVGAVFIAFGTALLALRRAQA